MSSARPLPRGRGATLGSGSISARSTSVAKALLLSTTLAAHLLSKAFATPLNFASQHFGALPFPVPDVAAWSRVEEIGTLHHGHEPEAPESTFQLVVDMVSIAGLVILGGIFAGLTLGLMGLDMVNLQVLSTSGSETEQDHARKVLKLLEKGRHWVLVVLLLGNVVVNESLPIFLSDFGGTAAVLVSTLLIVIFGEIVPQSICARHGLAIGAYCAPLVHATMIIMAPVAWPTAKLLDWALGEDHGTTYRKAELKTFVSLHQQIGTDGLNEDEVTIIRSVLELNDKTVSSVMTPIEDVYTMSADTIMNEENINHLVQSGYSRVPVHEPGKPDAIIGMLLVKRLITYDPEDAMPASWFQLTPLPETNPDLSLLDTLNYFQQGRSHMILVSTNPGENRGAMGIVTLEDVIEEVIGEEIVDETDVFVDVHNKIKVVRNRPQQGTSANYAGLVQGIIERRRKSGMMKRATPLKSAGTGVNKVAIKRPGSPFSTSSQAGESYTQPSGLAGFGSPRNKGAVLDAARRASSTDRGTGIVEGLSKAFTRTMTWPNAPEGDNSSQANGKSTPAVSGSIGAAANEASRRNSSSRASGLPDGSYIVEVDGGRTTLLEVGDIAEQPAAEEVARIRAEQEAKQQAAREAQAEEAKKANGTLIGAAEEQDESRPLLSAAKRMFGATDEHVNKTRPDHEA
ncbi:DUF21-domain-containing protein [Ceraceosorus guamensis]|uniref:DUF21-domain-containing protein n=1 Tax=Ceraceosorus guamensis TaxID=1522189 RepID=A0A316VUS0_9BASI|nr:DUF21-domain-containing protein [Ceraceosorus guamensis]PWN41200.1 DUF21-domain-containing protein [Ceraceosorus guamensis]